MSVSDKFRTLETTLRRLVKGMIGDSRMRDSDGQD